MFKAIGIQHMFIVDSISGWTMSPSFLIINKLQTLQELLLESLLLWRMTSFIVQTVLLMVFLAKITMTLDSAREKWFKSFLMCLYHELNVNLFLYFLVISFYSSYFNKLDILVPGYVFFSCLLCMVMVLTAMKQCFMWSRAYHLHLEEVLDEFYRLNIPR